MCTNIELKPMSLKVLEFLKENEPMTSKDISEKINLSPRQVDACVTKSLVRYGFAIRTARLTRLMKKDYNVISITENGKKYLSALKQEV